MTHFKFGDIVTESYGSSVTLVLSAVGSGTWSNGSVWRQKGGANQEDPPTTGIGRLFSLVVFKQDQSLVPCESHVKLKNVQAIIESTKFYC